MAAPPTETKKAQITKELRKEVNRWIGNLELALNRDKLNPYDIDIQNASINKFRQTINGQLFAQGMPEESRRLVDIQQAMARGREESEKELKRVNAEATKIQNETIEKTKNITNEKAKEVIWKNARNKMQDVQLGSTIFIKLKIKKIIKALQQYDKMLEVAALRPAA